MSSIYKAAYEALKNSSEGNLKTNYCCLCFQEIAADSESVVTEDEVVLDTVNGPYSNQMSDILVKLLGEEHLEITKLFNTVCVPCSKLTFIAYKFIEQCKITANLFTNAIDNLSDCFENVTEDLSGVKSLYVSIQLSDMVIEQLYDAKKLKNKTLVHPRFMYLLGKQFEQNNYTIYEEDTIKEESHEETGTKSRKKRDFSTIFIKTHELMADPNSKQYECKICHKVCATSTSLRLHFFSLHFKKDFQCSQCPKSFGTEGLLTRHVEASHCTVECDKCGKKLLNRTSTIKRHQMTHISKLRKTCHRCGRSYKKVTDFNKHLEQKTCEMPSRVPGDYICDNCGKHCHFKHQLTAHIKFEHGGAKGHICKWCGRKCYNKSALKIHILKHTREKNFVCSECGGKFVTRQSLINHSRLHSGERPYNCEMCDQSFLSASRRKEHIERHHTSALFACDLCDAKYSARRSLLQHKKKHHF